MKLTVLVDNNTLIDRYLVGEPGLSYYIEADGKKILFDVGYSDIFISNSKKLGLNILDIDYLVLSHGHLDHTWGLEPLVKRFTEEVFESRKVRKPKLVGHKEVFLSKTFTGEDEFGTIIDSNKVFRYFENNLTNDPFYITDNLVFLGQIPRNNDFEGKTQIGFVVNEKGIKKPDFNIDDSALCYKSEHGLIIMTGCSHSGICNIIEYAKELLNENRILDVIGGFHLQDPDEYQLKKTVEYFFNQNITVSHPCHCTDLKSKFELSKVMEVKEVGVGSIFKY
jgi:7,8-dihydropterin-6-yl-methyl-4-(beta-D-ribofuranosyl)aminobenzene 5'-phosphate synthase